MKVKLGEEAISVNFCWQYYSLVSKLVLNLIESFGASQVPDEGSRAHLDFRVIRSHSVADQTKRHRQLLIHVDLGMRQLSHRPVCRVEASWAGSNDS